MYADLSAVSAPVSLEDVVRRDPDVILAGPENAASLASDPRWQAVRAVREGDIAVVDTTLVGRPSVLLGAAAVHLATLLQSYRDTTARGTSDSGHRESGSDSSEAATTAKPAERRSREPDA